MAEEKAHGIKITILTSLPRFSTGGSEELFFVLEEMVSIEKILSFLSAEQRGSLEECESNITRAYEIDSPRFCGIPVCTQKLTVESMRWRGHRWMMEQTK